MKLAFMTVTVSLALAVQLQAAPKHILFLGNSFTYHGSDQDVPTAFSNIVVSAGYEAEYWRIGSAHK